MDTTNDRLRGLIERLGWTLADADRAAGVKSGRTWSYVRKDSTVTPPVQYINAIVKSANAAGVEVSADWLTSGNYEYATRPSRSTSLVREGTIPLYTTGFEVESFTRFTPRPQTDWSLPDHIFFMEVASNQYAPYLQKGDRVLCAESSPVVDGAIVAGVFNGQAVIGRTWHGIDVTGVGEDRRPIDRLGSAIAVIRNASQGLTVRYECPSVLTWSMMAPSSELE